MQLLVIKIRDLEQNPEYALLGKKQTQGRFILGDWSKVRLASRGRKVMVLLSSNDVVLTSVVIPSKNQKQLLQAIPYALEDTLAEDIEDLHFTAQQSTHSDDNESNVAIINRTYLSKVIDTLKTHKLTAHYVLPEILTQKYSPESWSIAYENINKQISSSVRLSKYNGFNCDAAMLNIFISEPLEKAPPKAIFSNTKVENLPAELQTIPNHYIESDTIEYDSAVSALPLNLLTNFVRHNQQQASLNLKAWKPTAVLGGLLASIWMGIFFWQNNQLQAQSNHLKSQIEQVYKDTFPNGRIVDAPVQMNSALNTLKANAGKTIESPLPLISNIGPLLKDYKDLVLSEMRYQENQLSMTIESPSLTRLENFKKDGAAKRNLKIDIKDSTTTANKVKAIILISPLPNKTVKTSESTINKENS